MRHITILVYKLKIVPSGRTKTRVKVIIYDSMFNISSLMRYEEVTCNPYLSGQDTARVRSETHLDITSQVSKILHPHHSHLEPPWRNHAMEHHRFIMRQHTTQRSISLLMFHDIWQPCGIICLGIYPFFETLIPFFLEKAKPALLILCHAAFLPLPLFKEYT